ncbi:24201_t:CDS:10 [Racocetra persica]|uniref:24201_t:CDS:1 n=1 Tax=Racocetra persica TaxID=160502 RepID=A0ACA9MW66_9GLOM|nr:24201_t:CDS:10 [Racocetra persica]
MASFININSDTDNTFEEIDFNEINEQSDDDNIEEIAYFTKNLTARHIQFSAVSVEYLSTDPEGYAIQYLQSGKDGSSNVNCPFFDESNNKKIQHTSVDFDSNIFQTIKNADESRTPKKIPCPYTQANDIRCTGDLVIKKRRTQALNSNELQSNINLNNGYFLGCISWKYDDNRNPVEANLIHLSCDITFYRLTPVNLIKYSYVALVSVGEHTHPPPPPSHISEAIKNHINKMINNASEYLDHITPRKIISSNLVHAYFGVNILSEIHALLKNLDQLRYLVDRIQQAKNPYGQGILGIVYNFWKNKNEIYFFDDGHIMILCITEEQAIKLYEAKYFQIDLTYKTVQGEINIFELNKYDENHQIILTYARIFMNISDANAYKQMFIIIIEAIKNLTNMSVKIKHIHNNGWSCILGDLDLAQAKELGLALSNIDPSLSWTEHLVHIFKTCRLHYQSLNQHCSKIDTEIWCIVGETTNIAELAHADINRDGKELTRRLDIQKFTTCKIQDKYGIAKTGKNNGQISHASQSIKCYGNSTKDNSLSQLEQQILLEEWQLEIEERKEKLREKKLQNYEKACELGIEKELGYED